MVESGDEDITGARPEGVRRWRRSPLGAVVGVALVLVGAGAVLISTSLAEELRGGVVGQDAAVNEGAGDLVDTAAHNSPTLSRNPVDKANLVVANRIDTPRYSCALHVSGDGGASWSQTAILAPPGEEAKCYAPDVTFTSDGTMYLSFVTLQGAGNVPHAAWISISKDGGRTLSKPTKALGPLSFQVRLVADPSVPGRLYLTWLQGSAVGLFKFSQTGSPIRFARSDDGGRTWRAPVQVSAPSRPRVVAPSLAVGPGGELYVLYLDLGDDRLDYEGQHQGRGGPPYQGRWKLLLSRSRDGGTNWAENVVDRHVVPTQRFIAFIPPFPSLAVDRRNGRLYAGFQDGRLGDPDVRVWRSGDRGATWRSTRVNDTREHDHTSQYLPKLAVAPDGRLDVVYYDRRGDRSNVMNQVTWQASEDGGKSFGASLRVSDRRFDSRIGFGSERGMPDLGSRLALLSADASALAVWSDTRAGREVSGKQDLRAALVSVSKHGRGASWLRGSLRYGGIVVGVAGLVLLAWWVASPAARRRRAGVG